MILPPPQRQGQIRFHLANGLPYTRRLTIIAGLLVVGFAVQMTIDLVVGALFLLAATLLATVRGFNNLPPPMSPAAKWREASLDQYRNILRISRAARDWDQSMFDITCINGFGGLILMGIATALGLVVFAAAGGPFLASAWGVDAMVLLLPHWVTGVRRILTNDPLVVKTELLLGIISTYDRIKRADEKLTPQLLVRHSDAGELPADAKVLVARPDLSSDYLGMHVQVTLNRVEGKDYPYLYCVLVARPSLKLAGKRKLTPPSEITCEIQRSDEGLDIMVLRQTTTKNSGYHTKRDAALAIFLHALEISRSL